MGPRDPVHRPLACCHGSTHEQFQVFFKYPHVDFRKYSAEFPPPPQNSHISNHIAILIVIIMWLPVCLGGPVYVCKCAGKSPPLCSLTHSKCVSLIAPFSDITQTCPLCVCVGWLVTFGSLWRFWL